MASVNKVFLIGNLGKDPESRITPAGVSMLKFSIATSKKWKENDDWKEKTDWHNITVFGKLVDNIKLSKGNMAYIEGEISNNEYVDNSGDKHYTYNIVASVVKNLSPKPIENKESDNNEQDDGGLK